MKIRDVMTRDVRTCRPTDTLDVPAGTMWEADCGVVPVVDDRRRVVGMVTDRDVCMAAYTQGKALGAIPVASAMSKTLEACSADDDLAVAERRMQTAKVRRLPVLDAQGRLAGIVSLGDLARRAAVKGKGKGVSADEVAATLGAICVAREPAPAGGDARGTRLLATEAPEPEC